jgi:hypothetical protein
MDESYLVCSDPKESYIKMRRIGVFPLLLAGTVFILSACSDTNAAKTPLGAASSAAVSADQPALSSITGEAKRSLDSGNVLFRAKAYDGALAQYSRSAELAPSEIAPLLGIMMVADVKKDAKLADATRARIRKLDPTVADSSSAMSHSKIIEAHPRSAPPAPPAPPST